jgi:hypothetical protein
MTDNTKSIEIDAAVDTRGAATAPPRKPWSTPRLILSEISANTRGGPFLNPESTSQVKSS